MTDILGQDGYGPGNKPQRGLDEGLLAGYVFSPRYRSDESDWDLVAQFSNAGWALFDPETWLLSPDIPPRGNLLDWEYWSDMHDEEAWSKPYRYARLTRRMLAVQTDLGFGALVASGPLLPTWNCYESAVLENAIAAALEWVQEYAEGTPVYAGVTVREAALTTSATSATGTAIPDHDTANWLDRLTQFGVDGVYLVVDWTTPDSSLPRDATVLSNLMYAVYALADLNQLKVVVGYTGLWSVLAMVAGADGVAAGWHLSGRRLSTARFRQASGPSRRAHRRVWVRDWLAEIPEPALLSLVSSVAPPDGCSQTAQAVLSGVPIPHLTDQTAETLHNWHVLSELAEALDSEDVGQRIATARALIDSARAFADERPAVSPHTDQLFAHLPYWSTALTRFEELSGLAG